MKHVLTCLSLTALAACEPQVAQPSGGVGESGAPIAAAAPDPAKPFVVSSKDGLLEFDYGWPAEAAAIPALDARFRDEMEQGRTEALATAEDDRALRRTGDAPFNAHMYSRSWTTAGQSPRLLSLISETHFFTGGAHPNHGVDSLLWDRATHKEIGVADLFDPPTRFAALVSKPWCDSLNGERIKKRGEQPKPGEMFWDCPPLDDLAIVPLDDDKDGLFEGIRFSAAPYVAGPYAEGQYDVDLPVNATLMTAMRPEYRASFELQPQ